MGYQSHLFCSSGSSQDLANSSSLTFPKGCRGGNAEAEEQDGPLMPRHSAWSDRHKESEMRTGPCCLFQRPFRGWFPPYRNKQNKLINRAHSLHAASQEEVFHSFTKLFAHQTGPDCQVQTLTFPSRGAAKPPSVHLSIRPSAQASLQAPAAVVSH